MICQHGYVMAQLGRERKFNEMVQILRKQRPNDHRGGAVPGDKTCKALGLRPECGCFLDVPLKIFGYVECRPSPQNTHIELDVPSDAMPIY